MPKKLFRCPVSEIAVLDVQTAVSASKTAVSDAETTVFGTFVPVKGALSCGDSLNLRIGTHMLKITFCVLGEIPATVNYPYVQN